MAFCAHWDSAITVGITSRGVEEIGQIQSISLPDEGEDFSKGEVICTVDGTNGSLEVVLPATGTIDTRNESAAEEPDVVSDDPMEEGWLVKIEIEDPAELLEYQEEAEGAAGKDDEEDE